MAAFPAVNTRSTSLPTRLISKEEAGLLEWSGGDYDLDASDADATDELLELRGLQPASAVAIDRGLRPISIGVAQAGWTYPRRRMNSAAGLVAHCSCHTHVTPGAYDTTGIIVAARPAQ